MLVSAENWQAIQETLHLLAVRGRRESIRKGMAEPLDESSPATSMARTTYRRINTQLHLVYEVFKKERKVRVLRMWRHYE